MSPLSIILCIAVIVISFAISIMFFRLCRNVSQALRNLASLDKSIHLLTMQGSTHYQKLEEQLDDVRTKANNINNAVVYTSHNMNDLLAFQPDIAVSILEEHFRKRKNEEGLMTVKTLRELLPQKKKPKTKIDKIV